MEDVLDLYAEPYDPQRPVVCFDETSTQLLADVTEPLPAKPGRPRREDYEYERAGTRNLFLTCEPRRGWRHVAITRQRTMQDFAHQMRWLVDEAYPDVPVIRLVLDNLNTHRMASLYETFPAAEARRIAKRLEFHHTPKHGSWPNPVLSLSKGWLRSSSACWLGPACTDATPTRTAWKTPSTPACQSGTRQGPASTGGSLPKTPDANSIASITVNPDSGMIRFAQRCINSCSDGPLEIESKFSRWITPCSAPWFNWQRSAFVLSCFSGWESGGLLESKEDANDKNR